MQSLRFISAVALVLHPGAQQSLDSVAHNLYPLLFKASYLLEQSAGGSALLLQHWPLEEFRLGPLLGPSADHAGT